MADLYRPGVIFGAPMAECQQLSQQVVASTPFGVPNE